MELGSNPTSQSAAPEDKCVKSEPHATTAVSSTPVPGLPRAKLHTAAQDFVPCRATMGYSAVRSHTCRAAVPAVSRLQDVTTAMMNRADTLAIEQVALPARLIWEALRYEFYGSGNGNVLPVPVEIPEDIADDSDSDEPLALEHAPDSSLDEESNDDEEEGTGFSV
ncbi:hypothetical protein PI125_g10914 [Phytophthora idaei]|nr:hypothetical protein PI125_g10914 [Phytophthora idaei]